MNTLGFTAAQALTMHGTGRVQAESIFEWAQNIGAEFQATLQVLILAIATGAALFIMIKRKFTLASVIIAGLVAGAALWVVFSGAVFVKERLTDTVESGGTRSVHVQVDPGLTLASGSRLQPLDLR